MLYNEEARRVAEYDAILRDSQRDIASLTEQTHRAMLQQQEVEKPCSESVLYRMNLIEPSMLRKPSGRVVRGYKTSSPVEADRQREQAYSTAKAVDLKLQSLQDSLQAT